MRKSIGSLALWMFGLAFAAAAGCSAPDPGVGYLGPRHSPNGGGANATSPTDDAGGAPAAAPVPTTVTPPQSSTPPAQTPDAGTAPDSGATATDAGGEGGAPSGFLGATAAYASAPVVTSARDSHAASAQAPQAPGTPCLACHGASGPGIAFLAAGWVATAANGTTGAPDVEVRVYATGAAAGFGAHTDADGFFWIKPPAGGATGPYQTGARSAASTNLMSASPGTGDCQSCHAGASGPIHVP